MGPTYIEASFSFSLLITFRFLTLFYLDGRWGSRIRIIDGKWYLHVGQLSNEWIRTSAWGNFKFYLIVVKYRSYLIISIWKLFIIIIFFLSFLGAAHHPKCGIVDSKRVRKIFAKSSLLPEMLVLGPNTGAIPWALCVAPVGWCVPLLWMRFRWKVPQICHQPHPQNFRGQETRGCRADHQYNSSGSQIRRISPIYGHPLWRWRGLEKYAQTELFWNGQRFKRNAERVGRHGVHFRPWNFRTREEENEDGYFDGRRYDSCALRVFRW